MHSILLEHFKDECLICKKKPLPVQGVSDAILYFHKEFEPGVDVCFGLCMSCILESLSKKVAWEQESKQLAEQMANIK